MTKLTLTLLIAGHIAFLNIVNAQESAEQAYEYVEEPSSYSEPVYQDPTGVQIKFNDDGTMRAILAVAEAELIFGDRKDIRQALSKAGMRAKAHISKFMSSRSNENGLLLGLFDTC